jgi:hypothetical protein
MPSTIIILFPLYLPGALNVQLSCTAERECRLVLLRLYLLSPRVCDDEQKTRIRQTRISSCQAIFISIILLPIILLTISCTASPNSDPLFIDVKAMLQNCWTTLRNYRGKRKILDVLAWDNEQNKLNTIYFTRRSPLQVFVFRLLASN